VEKTTERRVLYSVLLTKCYSGDQIKNNELDGASGTYGDRRGACRVLVGNVRVRDHLEDPGVDGRIIKIGSSRSGMGHGLD
jgi:hypothetical protein